MRNLILILLISCNALQAQSPRVRLQFPNGNAIWTNDPAVKSEWERWKAQRDEEIRTERKIYAAANYSLGALFAVLDATQDAITYSPGKTTKWNLNHGDYHAIKTWRNISFVGCGISLGGRTLSDISYEKGTGRIVRRFLVRLIGIGMVNYIAWDCAYTANRYGTPISLDPARYQHWSGIDWIDAKLKPTTKANVVSIHLLKFGLAAACIYLDEL